MGSLGNDAAEPHLLGMFLILQRVEAGLLDHAASFAKRMITSL